MKQSSNDLLALVFMLSVFLFLQSIPIIAQTDFVKYSGNPILPLGAPGEWDDTEAAYAHVLKDGSMYQMWYSGDSQLYTYRIGYATSSDGTSSWNKHPDAVLSVGAPGAFDDAQVWLPWVLFDGSLYEMWYTGNYGTGGIGYITSSDPAVWTRQRTTPVLAGDPGTWDNRAFGPVVLHRDSLYQMWYGGERNNLWQTGYATSPDGINWSKHPNNPVLTISAGEWDAVAAVVGSVLFDDSDSLYHMWYHGTSGDPFSGNKIGYATSPDGITWTKDSPNNPIVMGDSGAWDAVNNGFPRVIKEVDRYRMWYSGRGASDIDRLGYAWDPITDIKTIDATRPEDFYLKQNYPNPFNPSTTIEFVLPKSGFVTLKVFNLLGEEMATLLQAHKPAGQYSVNFDASKLSSGIYYYTLSTDNFKQTRKMVLLR